MHEATEQGERSPLRVVSWVPICGWHAFCHGIGGRDMGQGGEGSESASNTREQWKNTVLAGLANYIDGGSIVAGAAGLSLWGTPPRVRPALLGVLGAGRFHTLSARVWGL